jgi:hypothetical protein
VSVGLTMSFVCRRCMHGWMDGWTGYGTGRARCRHVWMRHGWHCAA